MCDYEATQIGNLNSHKKSIHNKLRHPCSICNKEFTQKSHLKTHQKGFHKMGEEIKCDFCEYRTAIKSHLSSLFISIHENVKYNCPLCDYIATQPQSLKQHKRSMHEIDMLLCQHCNDKFKTKNKLNMHLQLNMGFY